MTQRKLTRDTNLLSKTICKVIRDCLQEETAKAQKTLRDDLLALELHFHERFEKINERFQRIEARFTDRQVKPVTHQAISRRKRRAQWLGVITESGV